MKINGEEKDPKYFTRQRYVRQIESLKKEIAKYEKAYKSSEHLPFKRHYENQIAKLSRSLEQWERALREFDGGQ